MPILARSDLNITLHHRAVVQDKGRSGLKIDNPPVAVAAVAGIFEVIIVKTIGVPKLMGCRQLIGRGISPGLVGTNLTLITFHEAPTRSAGWMNLDYRVLLPLCYRLEIETEPDPMLGTAILGVQGDKISGRSLLMIPRLGDIYGRFICPSRGHDGSSSRILETPPRVIEDIGNLFSIRKSLVS